MFAGEEQERGEMKDVEEGLLEVNLNSGQRVWYGNACMVEMES